MASRTKRGTVAFRPHLSARLALSLLSPEHSGKLRVLPRF